MGSSDNSHRIQLPYLSPGYSGQGSSAFRVDPPEEGLEPVHSEKEALDAFWRTPSGRMCAQPGAVATARFGVYSGNRVEVWSDGRLTGATQPVTEPGWLAVVQGLTFRPSGPGRSRNMSPDDPGAPERRRSISGHSVHVISDATGDSLSALAQIGGHFQEQPLPGSIDA